MMRGLLQSLNRKVAGVEESAASLTSAPNAMQVTIKTPAEQEQMRVAGRLAADVLDMIGPYVVPGVTTEELNARCHDYIVNVQKAVPAPLNYRGFPKSICTSVNHVVCHGIPSPDKRLKQGDIINVDGFGAKNGTNTANAASVTLASTGELLWATIPRGGQ